MYPMTHRALSDPPLHAKREPSVRAVCPDCQTADAASQVNMTDVSLVLYHSCARCHLVWAPNLTGIPINGHGCRWDAEPVVVRLKPDRRLRPRNDTPQAPSGSLLD